MDFASLTIRNWRYIKDIIRKEEIPMKPTSFALSRRNFSSGSLLLFMVLIIVLPWACSSSNKSPNPPAKPSTGTFVWSDIPEPLVASAIDAGDVFVEQTETGETQELSDKNSLELAPGPWELKTRPGSLFKFKDPELKVEAGKTVRHVLLPKLPFSWKHPKLPTVAGASATWKGQINRRGGDDSTNISYTLFMQTFNEVTIEERRCRWLYVEVLRDSPAPVVKERAFLAVDIDAYETMQHFEVKSGWMMAHSRDIESELKTLFSEENGETEIDPPKEITVDFAGDSDLLTDQADLLQAPLPEHRLSLLDVMTLVMGANFPGASPQSAAARTSFSKLDEIFSSDVRSTSYEQLKCLVVQSRTESEIEHEKEGESAFFEIARSDAEVPFSFVRVILRDSSLEASLNLVTYYLPLGGTSSKLPSEEPPVAALQDAAERFQSLPAGPRFDLAAIPPEDGAWIRYKGTIALGPSRRTEYSATIAAIGTENRGDQSCRWLRLDINSGPENKPLLHQETAIVLVDPVAYKKSGAATILEGWLIYEHGKEHGDIDPYVLKFADSGDMQRTDDDLQMLEYTLSPERLSIHDVLALLFNANLDRSPSHFIRLRPEISARLSNTDGRKQTRGEKFMNDVGSIPVKGWDFKDDKVQYHFERSDAVPFSFISLNLTYGPVTLVANVDSNIPKQWDPVSFDKNKWEGLSKKTQEQIATWKEQNPNFRFWTIPTGQENDERTVTQLLAEWAGERKPEKNFVKGGFYLKPFSGEQKHYPSEPQLSTEDEVWKAEERHWNGLDDPAEYVPEERILFGKDPLDIKVLINGVEKRISWALLDMDDQLWVRQANLNWYSKQ